MEDEVAQYAVSHFAVTDSNPYCIGATRAQDAIAYGDIFSDPVFVFQRAWVSAQGQGVITCLDNAIGHRDVAAQIDVNPVAVQECWGIKDFDAVNDHIFAAIDEQRPIWGILESYILDQKIGAFCEHDHLSGTLLLFILYNGKSFRPIAICIEPGEFQLVFQEEAMAISLDASKSGDRGAVSLESDNKVPPIHFFRNGYSVLGEILETAIVFEIRTGAQNGLGAGQVQLDSGTQIDGSA